MSQVLEKREYVYNRTVQVKNADGSDTHRTMKMRTPHNETHLICTNYGMAFTKDRDPSDTKFAMIDRSIAHLVRSIGKSAHTDAEFHEHLSKPEQQRKLSIFRIFVCLIGAAKLCMKDVPAFQPNLALANKMFDYLDNTMIVGEYNLPRRSSRKSLKREENLRTLSNMKAVADVFVYQQPSLLFDSGQLDDDGLPQPFQWTMLYDVIRQARATPELIFMAWSQSLDYNIGTAAHSFAAMTAMCESFGIKVGDWMKKPTSSDLDDVRRSQAANSPSHGRPQQGTMSDDDYNNLIQNWMLENDRRALDSNIRDLPNLLDLNGLKLEDRMELLTGFERQRRATSLYRHCCTLDGNSDLEMSNPIELISHVLRSHGNPPDMGSEGAGGSNDDEYLPVYPSTILSNMVQVCMLYSYNSVVHWCADRASLETSGCPPVGTAADIKFSEKKTRGPCKYNTAWMRQDGRDGWMGYAKSVVSHNNLTCKMFDLPLNGLRDLFYMLSTRDNSRCCTEEPQVPHHMSKSLAFEDHRGQPVSEGHVGGVKMAGMRDTRSNQISLPGTESLKRHPYSKVVDVPLQRSLDFALTQGRLPAMMSVISNNVRDSAPVRILHDGEKVHVELNTSSAFEHTKMLAEAAVRCSMQPGLRNLQEAFCENSQGPTGLAVEHTGAAYDPDTCTKLSYSYDLVSIALTMDAMSRYYDPDAEEYVADYMQCFESMGLNTKVSDLPHMCMRFVGFEDREIRRFVSMPAKTERNPAFAEVEVGDAVGSEEDHHSIMIHLLLSLGHDPSDEEVDRYMKSRAGSRSMSGVTGDLLSVQTYRKHTWTTLKERGMVSGEDDPVMHAVTDDPYGLRFRVMELAAEKINELVEVHDDMKAAKEEEDDEELPEEKQKEIRDERLRRTRVRLYKEIELPEELENFRDVAHITSGTMAKLTYHNTPEDAEKHKSRLQSKKKRPKATDSASQFRDPKRMNLSSMPGGKVTVTSRGRQDSRVRR